MAVAGWVVILLFLYMILIGILIASYVMCSIGYQTIAQRRGIKCPWLAWIPIANYWVVGSIADEYNQRNGKESKTGRKLLILSIVAEVVSMIYFVFYFTFMLQVESVGGTGAIEPSFLIIVVIFVIISFAYIGLSIPLLVIYTIALYKIFKSTVPDKAVKYLLLSIFIPLAQGFCLLKCRNEGYPYNEYEEIIPEVIEQEENEQD